MSAESERALVIGAGLAGLVCAGDLLAAGKRVLVLEAEDAVGGRVRTVTTDTGFRLDRGFQVLFSAYPALRRRVPVAALQPRYFAPGVELLVDGHAELLGHPIFAPRSIPATVRSGLISARDIRALTMLLTSSLPLGDGRLPSSDISTGLDLQRRGASQRFIERVIGPLFGGISLDRSLSSESTFWRFVLRSMVLGRVFVPTFGIGQLTQLLAARLPATAIQLNTHVHELLVEDNRAVGVVAGGKHVRAEAVVVATEAPTAQRLTGIRLPVGQRSCTTAYFASEIPVTDSKRLMLHSAPSMVNHAVQLTNISPAYAPHGRHLLSATAIDVPAGDDTTVAEAMLRDLRSWLPYADRLDPRPVAVVRVPYAQFVQGPGVYRTLPGADTDVERLCLAGEFLHSSSVQGAMRGGELAAAAVLRSAT